jgi:hypothetical protein
MLALLLPGAAGAQTYKCTDAKGKTTYTGSKCSDLGLKDAGEVGDRVNVSPAYRPPAGYTPPPRPAETPRQTQQPPAAQEEAKPERRCFTTAKGTRCNDVPGDDAPAEAPR